MEIERIEQSLIRHIEDLFEWSEAYESKVFNPIDHSDPLWENELLGKNPSDIDEVLKNVKERFERVGSGKYCICV